MPVLVYYLFLMHPCKSSSIDSKSSQRIAFYLSFLRRKGKYSILFSKKACFVKDLESNKWIYLELKRNSDGFAWGCSSCKNLKRFRYMQGLHLGEMVLYTCSSNLYDVLERFKSFMGPFLEKIIIV